MTLAMVMAMVTRLQWFRNNFPETLPIKYNSNFLGVPGVNVTGENCQGKLFWWGMSEEVRVWGEGVYVHGLQYLTTGICILKPFYSFQVLKKTTNNC